MLQDELVRVESSVIVVDDEVCNVVRRKVDNGAAAAAVARDTVSRRHGGDKTNTSSNKIGRAKQMTMDAEFERSGEEMTETSVR